MKLTVKFRSTSIAEIMDSVDQLRENGVSKDNIYIITNQASKETIRNNYDLRKKDGSIFSSHRLLENVHSILHLQEYEGFYKRNPLFEGQADPLKDYYESIGYGTLVVAIMTTS